MSESIVVAVISGGLALVGTVVSVIGLGRKNAEKMAHQLDVSQAVTNEKISELTREVREHNGFARRLPVVEEQIKVINHRIADLEEQKNEH